MTYWMDGKTTEQKEKEELFGVIGVKVGKTRTENTKFFVCRSIKNIVFIGCIT